jgi:transposase
VEVLDMRGAEQKQSKLFHHFSVEECIPADHPIRAIRSVCDEALSRLDAVFEAMYSDCGRPSIAPEALLKSQVLQALFSVRSDRLFCEMLGYNILFRWFLGMDMETSPFDHSVFTHNRKRLIEHEVGKEFLASVVEIARERGLLSDEHFTVDGTLIESWASLKSFKPKDGKPSGGEGGRNPSVDFHGEKRANATHQSTTDPEARLAKKGKGKEAKLCHMGHALTDNRHGLVVDAEVTAATGTAECVAAEKIVARQRGEGIPIKTLGADKNYHNAGMVKALRDRNVKPHIALHSSRNTPGLDGRTTRRESYQVSQRKRKLVEEVFGFAKSVAGLRKCRFVGAPRTALAFFLILGVYDIVRIARLTGP